LAAEDPKPGESIATAVTEISERASLLIREEIELAKAEVTEKVTKLAKGAAVGTAAGIFVITGLLFLLHGLAWLLFSLLFEDVFWGFFIVSGSLFLLAGIAGFLAQKWLKGGSPPTPVMAIDEAQRIKGTLTGERGGQLEAVEARAEAEEKS